MDVNKGMGRALRAAKRGDLDTLEVELASLRALPAESLVGVRAQLRAIARSVRAHPSFKPAAAAQAG